MNVRITGQTTGPTTMRMTHEDSGAQLETMAPKDNGGEGMAFSPTDLFAASLASCGATIMGMYARNAGIPVAGISFSVEKEMSGNPRRVGRLTLLFEIRTNCSEREFKKIVNAGKLCPVRHSLHPDIDVYEEFVRLPEDAAP